MIAIRFSWKSFGVYFRALVDVYVVGWRGCLSARQRIEKRKRRVCSRTHTHTPIHEQTCLVGFTHAKTDKTSVCSSLTVSFLLFAPCVSISFLLGISKNYSIENAMYPSSRVYVYMFVRFVGLSLARSKPVQNWFRMKPT